MTQVVFESTVGYTARVLRRDLMKPLEKRGEQLHCEPKEGLICCGAGLRERGRCWEIFIQGRYDGYDVSARRYDADWNPVTGEIQLKDDIVDYKHDAAVAATSGVSSWGRR